jgi:hypothetical protein
MCCVNRMAASCVKARKRFSGDEMKKGSVCAGPFLLELSQQKKGAGFILRLSCV